MENQELNAMEALANAATPGPWKFGANLWQDAKQVAEVDGCFIYHYPADNLPSDAWDDAGFIAAARTFIPEAIAEIRRLSTPTTIGEGKTGLSAEVLLAIDDAARIADRMDTTASGLNEYAGCVGRGNELEAASQCLYSDANYVKNLAAALRAALKVIKSASSSPVIEQAKTGGLEAFTGIELDLDKVEAKHFANRDELLKKISALPTNWEDDHAGGSWGWVDREQVERVVSDFFTRATPSKEEKGNSHE